MDMADTTVTGTRDDRATDCKHMAFNLDDGVYARAGAAAPGRPDRHRQRAVGR